MFLNLLNGKKGHGCLDPKKTKKLRNAGNTCCGEEGETEGGGQFLKKKKIIISAKKKSTVPTLGGKKIGLNGQ